MSARLGRAAGHAAAAVPAVEHVIHAADTLWSGGAAGAFVAGIERAPVELAKAQDTLRTAIDILDDWVDRLLANQRTADRLDRRALELRRAIENADDEVASASAALRVAIGSATRIAEADHAAAVARRSQLSAELDRVLDQARVLEREHLAAAQRVAERLRALGSDEAQAAGRLPMTGELFGELTHTLGALSAQASGLALTLLGSGAAMAVPPVGAVSRFASAIAGPRGNR